MNVLQRISVTKADELAWEECLQLAASLHESLRYLPKPDDIAHLDETALTILTKLEMSWEKLNGNQ